MENEIVLGGNPCPEARIGDFEAGGTGRREGSPLDRLDLPKTLQGEGLDGGEGGSSGDR